MTRLGPVIIRWRPIVFFSALFWFWYLVPVAAESSAIVRVLHYFQH